MGYVTMSKGQVSVEFIILFLALLVAIVISTMTPGVFGLTKTVELSSASLAHAALSKVKSNVEMLSVSDEGSLKLVYVKSPSSKWEFNNKSINVVGDGFNISTTTSIGVKKSDGSSSFSYTVPTLKIITVELERKDSYVQVNIS
jgi:uncharacterized protein (UPF0333 family)